MSDDLNLYWAVRTSCLGSIVRCRTMQGGPKNIQETSTTLGTDSWHVFWKVDSVTALETDVSTRNMSLGMLHVPYQKVKQWLYMAIWWYIDIRMVIMVIYIYIWENMWKTPQVFPCFPHLWRHLDLTGQVFFLDSRCAEVNSICWDPWPQVLRHKWCAKNQCSAWQTARGHLDPMAQRLKNKNGLSKYGSHRTYIYIT